MSVQEDRYAIRRFRKTKDLKMKVGYAYRELGRWIPSLPECLKDFEAVSAELNSIIDARPYYDTYEIVDVVALRVGELVLSHVRDALINARYPDSTKLKKDVLRSDEYKQALLEIDAIAQAAAAGALGVMRSKTTAEQAC